MLDDYFVACEYGQGCQVKLAHIIKSQTLLSKSLILSHEKIQGRHHRLRLGG